MTFDSPKSKKENKPVGAVPAAETLQLLHIFTHELFRIYRTRSFSDDSLIQTAHTLELKLAENAYNYFEFLTAINILKVGRHVLTMKPGLDANERYPHWFQFQSSNKQNQSLERAPKSEEALNGYSPCIPRTMVKSGARLN